MPEPQTGRIGGGVLKDNLVRNGSDLNFKNTVSDMSLLHLDVNNLRIGVNTDVPDYALELATNFKSENLLSTTTSIDTVDFANSTINYFTGSNLQLSAGSTIEATSIATDALLFDYNTISTRTTNTNIELRPDGNGALDIQSDWNITGDLHSTGNIVFGGNLILGDSDQDDVTFAADLNSHLIPNTTDNATLGNSIKEWQNIYSNIIQGETIVADQLVITTGGALQTRQGNTFYVSTLGDNNNVGDHQHGAFRTIAHALSQVDASTGGPVTIHVFPGEYEEIFPLVLPERVTILGHDLRNTIITPTAGTNTNNAFELNQNCMVTDVTIKDFYSPGHAFTFANNAIITERSPYIQNVTVITKGSVVSATDPRGFNQGDAGKGALVDGSVINSATINPSMLFYAVTFITPGVDGLTMTNGVRVEWLNCFTYFANRGLYATNGTAGKANDGTTFGAEIRSIGSANVYGNYGAVADGADTLMYLISHNFAYIGVGNDVTNDKTLTIEANQITKLNNGSIHNVSTSASGKFSVGDSFFADYETGTTSLAIDSANFAGLSQITINDNFDVTYIDGERIDTGNLRLSGNTLTTIDGQLEISPATSLFNTNTNPALVLSNGLNNDRTNVTGSIRYNTETSLFEGYSTANLSFGGSYSDDRQTSIAAHDTNNSLIFTANGTTTSTLTSSTLTLNGLSSGDILFNNSLVTTTDTNSNLDLRANGTGKLSIYDININDKNIINTSNNNLVIASTGLGYIKFDSTTGLVVPFGTTAQRSVAPILGETRWNQDENYLETYNSENEWQRSAGLEGEVNEDTIRELVDLYIMVLG